MSATFRKTTVSILKASAPSNLIILLFVLLVGLTATLEPASAQPAARATLTVTGYVEGSMTVEFTAGSVVRNVGSSGGSASLTVPTFGGSFSPSATTAAVENGKFVITSSFGINVRKANLATTSYTLKAKLEAPAQGHLWRIDGVEISTGPEQAIAISESYDRNNSHTLTVSGAAPEQLQSSLIRFTVVAN